MACASCCASRGFSVKTAKHRQSVQRVRKVSRSSPLRPLMWGTRCCILYLLYRVFLGVFLLTQAIGISETLMKTKQQIKRDYLYHSDFSTDTGMACDSSLPSLALSRTMLPSTPEKPLINGRVYLSL